jgi:C-terminal processing protease CtpA/Prc
VALLIGPNSVSAAETFAQALLERRPAVTRIGKPTQGVFSDVLGRTLPNGWTFGLPNERYTTRGRTYDRTGVPPDVDIPLFLPADVEAGRDTGIEAALRTLRGG